MNPAALLVCAVMAAEAPQAAETAPATAVEADETRPVREWARGFHGLAHLDLQTGSPFTVYNAAFSVLTLRPRYGFALAEARLEAGIDWGVSYELTTPDNSLGRRFGWSSLLLSLAAPDIVRHEATGFALTPALSTTAPTAATDVITVTSLHLRGDMSRGRVRAGVYATGARSFRLSRAQARLEPVTVDGHLAFICRDAPDGCLVRATNSPDWAATLGLLGEVDVGRAVFVGLSGAFHRAWVILARPDEFSSQAVNSNRDPIATLVSSRDVVSYRLHGRWNFARFFGLAVGVSESRSPRMPDGRAFSLWALQNVRFTIGLYGRTDAALSPEWLLP